MMNVGFICVEQTNKPAYWEMKLRAEPNVSEFIVTRFLGDTSVATELGRISFELHDIPGLICE
jgi:hypothetical protein